MSAVFRVKDLNEIKEGIGTQAVLPLCIEILLTVTDIPGKSSNQACKLTRSLIPSGGGL